MTPFVVAAFRHRGAAEAAAQRVRQAPEARSVHLHDSTSDVENAATLEIDETVTGGFFGNAASLLDGLFNTRPGDAHAHNYDDLVRREATLLSVSVDSRAAAKKVEELLTEAGAERVSTLPQAGLEG